LEKFTQGLIAYGEALKRIRGEQIHRMIEIKCRKKTQKRALKKDKKVWGLRICVGGNEYSCCFDETFAGSYSAKRSWGGNGANTPNIFYQNGRDHRMYWHFFRKKRDAVACGERLIKLGIYENIVSKSCAILGQYSIGDYSIKALEYIIPAGTWVQYGYDHQPQYPMWGVDKLKQFNHSEPPPSLEPIIVCSKFINPRVGKNTYEVGVFSH